MSDKLINWEEKYSVGFEEIDTQHKNLVEMINELHNSFTQGKADELAKDIIDEMIKYTDYHFKTEEKYFKKHNYSEIKKHMEQHKGFVAQVTSFQKDFIARKVTITYDLMNFLRDWLLNHIQVSDKKFGLEFQKRNIKVL